MNQFLFGFDPIPLVYTTPPLRLLLLLDDNMELAIADMHKMNPRNINAASALAEVHLLCSFPTASLLCRLP
jgi:hypothetical protein